MTRTAFVPGGDSAKTEPAKPGAHPPQNHTPPDKNAPAKGGAVDHKAAIDKMHPEHLHRLVQDAHSGKFGSEAQNAAQQAMQAPAQGAPAEQGAPQEAAPNYAGMFGGGAQNDNDDDDQPVPAGRMFGGR